MTPTLSGRLQSRLFLVAFVGVPIALLLGVVLRRVRGPWLVLAVAAFVGVLSNVVGAATLRGLLPLPAQTDRRTEDLSQQLTALQQPSVIAYC